MFVFASVIILLQFRELFAWRDGLYLKYLDTVNLFVETFFQFAAGLAVSDL